MMKAKIGLFLGGAILAFIRLGQCQSDVPVSYQDPMILSYEIDPSLGEIHFYLKNEVGKSFENHKHLKEWLRAKNQELTFAMNGGMYLKDLSPQGLYIENGQTLKQLDVKEEGYGNFYLQPNGVFYLTTENAAGVCTTKDFVDTGTIKYATQSGPMLVVDKKIHPIFNSQSNSVYVRNGVGILPNGKLIFAMSKEKINLFHFAEFFLRYGCVNALYLDGFVSRTYLPAQNWMEEEGYFGVIIAEVKDKL